MNIQEIEHLTEKYFNGETTLEEEKILQKYFSGIDIPEHLKGLIPLFTLHQNEMKVELPDRMFDEKITTLIQNNQKAERKFRRSMQLTTLLAIAAVVIFSVTSIYQTKNADHERKIDEAELAYIEINKALMYVATQLNKGLQPVQKSGNQLEMAFEPVIKIGELEQTLNKVAQINANLQ
ncbi:MAG: hypothetical protein Q8J88_01515 [Bacteroidales bacterium]|nr:hypothetical protein [Bacteroidales bacterium]